LVTYVRASVQGDAAALESLGQTLGTRFAAATDRHEGVKALQALLKSQGDYRGAEDGMFGLATRSALQLYLKRAGYYKGATDGMWGRESRRALGRLQTALGVKATGAVTLETAQAIERHPAQ
jgi:hypothetical protein